MRETDDDEMICFQSILKVTRLKQKHSMLIKGTHSFTLDIGHELILY